MRIGEAANSIGLSAHTLRYYERIGLVRLKKNERQANNYREYNEDTIDLLKTLKSLREMGFTISDMQELKGSWENHELECTQLKEIIKLRIEELTAKVAALRRIENELDKISLDCKDCFDSVRLISRSDRF